MLVVRCTVVEYNLCSRLLSIMLYGSTGGMTDSGRVTDAVDPSSTAPLFSIDYSCSL